MIAPVIHATTGYSKLSEGIKYKRLFCVLQGETRKTGHHCGSVVEHWWPKPEEVSWVWFLVTTNFLLSSFSLQNIRNVFFPAEARCQEFSICLQILCELPVFAPCVVVPTKALLSVMSISTVHTPVQEGPGDIWAEEEGVNHAGRDPGWEDCPQEP